MDNEIVEVDGRIAWETEKAILFNDGSDFDVWLPKSQITYFGDVGEETIVEMPEWLAFDKGLI